MDKYQDGQWVICNKVLSDQYECVLSLLLNSVFLLVFCLIFIYIQSVDMLFIDKELLLVLK